jgi:hypothetical protein
MQEETIFWLAKKIPRVKGGVHLAAYETILQITAGVSSRVFIGLPASRDPTWLETALGYTSDVFRVSSALRPYPAMVRLLIAPVSIYLRPFISFQGCQWCLVRIGDDGGSISLA